MNAVEFVQKQINKFGIEKGWEEVDRVLSSVPLNWCFAFVDLRSMEISRSMPSHDECVSIGDIEQLVGSWDLIQTLGGLEKAKSYVPDPYKSERLKKAIHDVESIGGGS